MKLLSLVLMLVVSVIACNGPAWSLEAPAAPVILVPGLGGKAETWAAFRRFLRENSWRDGGTLGATAGGGLAIQGGLAPGDIYVMESSGPSTLGLKARTEELARAVEAVLRANQGKDKVILIGHSMGGLAARHYVQLGGGRAKVAQIITVGTPHSGAMEAKRIRKLCPSPEVAIALCGAVAAAGIVPWGEAVGDLEPDSVVMKQLGDLNASPLPSTAQFISIIGSGMEATLTGSRTRGDGVVSVEEQDLARVPGAENLPRASKQVLITRRDDCKIGLGPVEVKQLHLCGPGDQGVWAAVLRALSDGRVVAAPSPAGAPRRVEAAKDAGQGEFTFRMKDGSTVSGKVQVESLEMRTSLGMMKVPLGDVGSYSGEELRLKDGSVLKGQIVNKSLSVLSKYGRLSLSVPEIMWFGAGTPPVVATQEAPRMPQTGGAGSARIVGKVVDGFNHPLAGVDVKIENTAFAARSDATGQYEIGYVPGKVKLTFTKAGYTSRGLELEIAAAADFPAEGITLYKLPTAPGILLFGQNDYIPLRKGRIQLTTKQLSAEDLRQIYTAHGNFIQVQRANRIRFLDSDSMNQQLFRLGRDNVVLARIVTTRVWGTEKPKYPLIHEKVGEVSRGIFLREIEELEDGKYAFASMGGGYVVQADAFDLRAPVYLFTVGEGQPKETVSSEQPSDTVVTPGGTTPERAREAARSVAAVPQKEEDRAPVGGTFRIAELIVAPTGKRLLYRGVEELRGVAGAIVGALAGGRSKKATVSMELETIGTDQVGDEKVWKERRRITRDASQTKQQVHYITLDGRWVASDYGSGAKRLAEPIPLLREPITAGAEWESSEGKCTIAGFEKVKTPAGTFEAVRRSCAWKRFGNEEVWLSPGVGLVKSVSVSSERRSEFELVDIKQ